jgi:hypothetical protein
MKSNVSWLIFSFDDLHIGTQARILVDMSTPTRRHQPQICCMIVRAPLAATTFRKRTYQFGGTLSGHLVVSSLILVPLPG